MKQRGAGLVVGVLVVLVLVALRLRPHNSPGVYGAAVKYPVAPADAPSATPFPTATTTPTPTSTATPSILTNGPLQLNPQNPLYFMKGQGETV
jgi:hypothetical protein